MALLFGGVLVSVALLAGSRDLKPPLVIGCYTTPKGPDILVDRQALHVLQARPLKVLYRLEYQKGWTLTLDRWLNFQPLPDGSIEFMHGPDFGEFVFLSREGTIANATPGFQLTNHPDGDFVQYSRVGPTCRN